MSFDGLGVCVLAAAFCALPASGCPPDLRRGDPPHLADLAIELCGGTSGGVSLDENIPAPDCVPS